MGQKSTEPIWNRNTPSHTHSLVSTVHRRGLGWLGELRFRTQTGFSPASAPSPPRENNKQGTHTEGARRLDHLRLGNATDDDHSSRLTPFLRARTSPTEKGLANFPNQGEPRLLASPSFLLSTRDRPHLLRPAKQSGTGQLRHHGPVVQCRWDGDGGLVDRAPARNSERYVRCMGHLASLPPSPPSLLPSLLLESDFP